MGQAAIGQAPAFEGRAGVHAAEPAAVGEVRKHLGREAVLADPGRCDQASLGDDIRHVAHLPRQAGELRLQAGLDILRNPFLLPEQL